MLRSWFWLPMLFAIWAFAQQPQELTLRLRYQEGQTLVYKATMDGKVSVISEVGMAMDLQLKGELKQEQLVEEVADDGTSTLLVTVSGKMQMGMTGTPTSGAPPGQQTSAMDVPPMKVRMKLSPNGRVLELKPVQDEKQPKPAIPNPFQDPFQSLASGSNLMGLIPSPLPDKPVKFGDTWDLSGTVNLPLPDGKTAPVKVKGQGKLLSTERKGERECAVTEIQVEVPELMEIMSKAAPLKEMGVDLQAKGGVKTTMRNWYDIASGILVHSEATIETKMDALIQMPANLGGGVMTLHSVTNMKSITELTEVKAKP